MVEDAVAAAGGRLLTSTGSSTAPLFIGVEAPNGERIGIMAYVFSANREPTSNRPSDEHRGQIRYRDAKTWPESDHPLGFDPAAVDLTVVLVAHPDAGLLLALDPLAYDPLPLGNSIYFKDADIVAAARDGWRVWERNTHNGKRKRKKTAEPGLETIIAFTPDRLFDYLAVERQAQTLRLDHTLRFGVAERGGTRRLGHGMHELEEAFGLPSFDILDIIRRKNRLAMAMRGGVAEHHLGLALDADPLVQAAEEGHQEGPPDFFVELADGRTVTVECKNASPKRYADGTPKVEVQKTRASQGDPTSRFYAPAAFDVVAACMYGPTGKWTFRFRRSADLVPHTSHPDRIAPLQPITDAWAHSLAEALDA